MTKREVIRAVLGGGSPPYVPWSFSFTMEAGAKLQDHYSTTDLDRVLHNHLVDLGDPVGFLKDVGEGDVSLESMLAFIEVAHGQEGFVP